MADDYVGSNAAFTRVRYLHYWRYYRLTVYWMLVMAGLMAGVFFLHWVCAGLVLGFAVVTVVWGMRRTAGMMSMGTTNAAIVTCVEPFTIAALAELTMVPGKSFPGVQIRQVPNPFGGGARVGMKLPVVCNYTMFEGTDERWGSILPHPIAAVTPDAEAVEHAARMIPPVDWVVLEKALKTISDLKTEKMHLIPASKAADQRSEEFFSLYRRNTAHL
jgi:hypothetical protein